MLKTALPVRVRMLRNRAGLSQHALSVYCGVTRSTINDLESGLKEPRLSTLIAVCRFLAVSPDAILGWDEYGAADAARSLTCERCQRPAIRGAPHGVGDCIREMRADGKAVRAIALVHGFSERAVNAILEDEHARVARG